MQFLKKRSQEENHQAGVKESIRNKVPIDIYIQIDFQNHIGKYRCSTVIHLKYR